MKSAMILFTLVIFGLASGDAVNNAGTAAISRLKMTTRTTTNDLSRYSNKLSSDLSTKLFNLKIDQMQNINGIVNPAIADVRTMISRAGANGKNAEHCFEPARLRLRQASLSAYKELDECAETGKSSVNPVKSNIEATILLGNRIINDLDAIAINCYSSNSMQMQNCIIGKIPDASASVRALENTASELKRTGDATASSAVVTAFSCNLKAPQKMREEATSVRIDTGKCVDNA